MRCVVAVAAVVVCGVLFAQAGKLDVRWRIWEPEASAALEADSDTLASDAIRPKTFGWNRDKALDRFDVTLPWRRSRICLAWWQAIYAGSQDLSNIFTYAGVQYDPGTSLYCRFRTLNYSARWEYDLTTAGRSAVISGGFGLLFSRYYLRLEGTASGLPQHNVWRFDRTFPYLSLSIYTVARTKMGNLFVGASVLFSGGLKFGSTRLKSFSETCLFFNLAISGVGIQLGFVNHSLETSIATGSLRHRIRYSMPGPFIGFSVWF